MEKNYTQPIFGLLLDSMKGLEFIPTPPVPHSSLPQSSLTQVDPFVHTHTHAHTTVTPMSPSPPSFLYSQKVEVLDQVFKQFIFFLSLTCVFISHPIIL